MRSSLFISVVVVLLCSCTNEVKETAERYKAEVEAFAADPKFGFLANVYPIGTDFSDPKKDSLKILPPEDSLFKKWLDDPNVVELFLAHTCCTDRAVSTDPYYASYKSLPDAQWDYLFRYPEKVNDYGYSMQIGTWKGMSTEISFETWEFTSPPEYFFTGYKGYVKIELHLTDPTGETCSASSVYFRMLILVPEE